MRAESQPGCDDPAKAACQRSTLRRDLNPDFGVCTGPKHAPSGIDQALRSFTEISLEETNKSASMLKRVDNKYAVGKATLLSALGDLKGEFKVLSIDGQSIFSYRSCYFDDGGRCFEEHRQGRRQRFKVRTRLYVESDKAYFEVKLKGKRGQTEKSREKCEDFNSFAISDQQLQLLRELYESNYGKRFIYDIAPALHVAYNRFTLVSASGGERITIDINLCFEAPSGRKVRIGDDFIIVETKSCDGRGAADRVMKRRRIRQAAGCSKYCIGMILTGEVKRYNRFREILKIVRPRIQPSGTREAPREARDCSPPDLDPRSTE